MSIQYVLLSHGKLSEGMKHAAQMIVGEMSNLHSLGMKPDEGVDKLLEDLKILMSNYQNEKFVFITDLFGGSVNNTLFEHFNLNPDVEIVTGMNLSLVLSIILEPDTTSDDIQIAVKAAKDNIIYMKDINLQYNDDE